MKNMDKTIGEIAIGRSNNPSYFERVECEICQSRDQIQIHRYSDRVMCDCCVNELLEQAAREDEIESGKYCDENEALTLAEREA